MWWWCSVVVKTQSAKICLNFNFLKGGGVFCSSQYSKCQDLSKFKLGGGVFCSSQNSSANIWPTFHFREGGVLYQIPEQGVLANLSKNFALPCYFLEGLITDSLSHTTYVETDSDVVEGTHALHV